MAVDVSEGYIAALKERTRQIKIQSRIRNRLGDVRFGPEGLELLDGEISFEWPGHMDAPVHTARVTYADPERLLDLDLTTGDGNNVWFSCKLDVKYGLMVNGAYEYCPAFRGWIVEGTRRGDEMELVAVGKEAHHQGNWCLRHGRHIDRGTKYSEAIFDIINWRGIDDDIVDIPILAGDEKLQKHRHYSLGMEPWKIMQFMARELDKQLFWRQNGHIVLREFPGLNDVSWVFNKSGDSIVTEWPEQRLSMGDFVNTVFVTTEKVVHNGPAASERPQAVVGFATLPDGAALSAQTLSGTNKPVIEILDRPGVKTFFRANQIADRVLAAKSNGLDTEVSLTCLPLPHLEPMDVVKVGFGTAGIDVHKFRLQRATYGLTPDSTMSINWQGSKKPDTRRRKKFDKRKGRRKRYPPRG